MEAVGQIIVQLPPCHRLFPALALSFVLKRRLPPLNVLEHLLYSQLQLFSLTCLAPRRFLRPRHRLRVQTVPSLVVKEAPLDQVLR